MGPRELNFTSTASASNTGDSAPSRAADRGASSTLFAASRSGLDQHEEHCGKSSADPRVPATLGLSNCSAGLFKVGVQSLAPVAEQIQASPLELRVFKNRVCRPGNLSRKFIGPGNQAAHRQAGSRKYLAGKLMPGATAFRSGVE